MTFNPMERIQGEEMKKAGVLIYYQPRRLNDIGRIRIIEPNGNTQWMSSPDIQCQHHSYWHPRCCFVDFCDDLVTQEHVIKAMRRYDEQCGYPPAELIGEL